MRSKGRHGRIKQPVSDRDYLILEGEGEFLFGNWEKDEIVSVAKDLVPIGGYRLRLLGEDAALSHMHACPRAELQRCLDDLWD